MLELSTAASGSATANGWLVGSGLIEASTRSASGTSAEWVRRGPAGGVRRVRATTGSCRLLVAARSTPAVIAASAGPTAPLRVGRDLPGELPQVVARRATERSNRRFLALTRDAADAAHRHPLRLLWILNPRRRRGGARGNQLPLTLLGEWVLVFLSEVLPFDERIDVGGKPACLGSIRRDRSRVLHAAKDRFLFFLALGFVSPDRHGDRHEDGHDGHHHEQRSHGVSAFAAPIGLTT